MHIHALIQPTGLDFVRDAGGKVVYVEQSGSPQEKDPRGYWTECVRTDDNTIHQPNHPRIDRGEPVFSLQGGRAYATFPLVVRKS
jgi:hypothetical protein